MCRPTSLAIVPLHTKGRRISGRGPGPALDSPRGRQVAVAGGHFCKRLRSESARQAGQFGQKLAIAWGGRSIVRDTSNYCSRGLTEDFTRTGVSHLSGPPARCVESIFGSEWPRRGVRRSGNFSDSPCIVRHGGQRSDHSGCSPNRSQTPDHSGGASGCILCMACAIRRPVEEVCERGRPRACLRYRGRNKRFHPDSGERGGWQPEAGPGGCGRPYPARR